MNPQLAIAITAKNQTKPAFDEVVSDANRVGSALANQGARATGVMNNTGFATANVAAQLNDIGVMMASGQSPFILAIQQGTQLNQVFSGMSGPQVLGMLKTAFLSLINPISLITIGTIAAGAALFQYVTSLNTDGRQSTEVIKEQNDLIRRVAQNWGAAYPLLKAYVDELDRAASLDELNQATNILSDKAFADAKRSIGEVRAELAAARIDIQSVGGTSEEIDALQSAFDTLYEKVSSNNAGTEDLASVLGVLAGTTGSETVPSLLSFKGILEALIPTLRTASTEVNKLKMEQNGLRIRENAREGFKQRDFIAEQERLNSLTAEQLSLEREMERVRGEAKSGDVLLTEQQIVALAEQRLNAEKRRSDLAAANRSGAKSISDLERERQGVIDMIEALEHEQAMLGKTSLEKEIANAHRRAGAAATDAERERIEELIVAINAQEEAQKFLEKTWANVQATGFSAARGIADALRDGKLEAAELNEILARTIDSLLDIGFGMLQSGFSSFGNPLAGLFGGGGGGSWNIPTSYVPGGFYPGLAGGGTVASGGLTWVGEEGPELLNLPAGASVTPTRESFMALSGSEGRRVEVHVHQDPNHQGPPEARVESKGGVDLVQVVLGAVAQGVSEGRLDRLFEANYGLKRRAVS